jgi:hypothetical protein
MSSPVEIVQQQQPKELSSEQNHLKNTLNLWIKNHSGFEYDEKSALAGQLTCIICQDLFHDPKQHKTCQNSMCFKCWEKLTKCPFCQGDVQVNQLTNPCGIVQHMLDTFPMQCKECGTTCQKQSINIHMEQQCTRVCGYCDDHQSKFNSDTYLNHLKTQCKHSPFDCIAKDVECPWTGKGYGEYKEHFQACVYNYFRGKIIDYKTQIDQLKLVIEEKQQQQIQRVSSQSQPLSFQNNLYYKQSLAISQNIYHSHEWVLKCKGIEFLLHFSRNPIDEYNMELKIQLKTSEKILNPETKIYFCVNPLHPVYHDCSSPIGNSSKKYSETFVTKQVNEVVISQKKIFTMTNSEFNSFIKTTGGTKSFTFIFYIYFEHQNDIIQIE